MVSKFPLIVLKMMITGQTKG